MENGTYNITRLEEIMPTKKTSRSNKLLKHMLRGQTINGRQALSRFGIYRLSAIIFNWRKKGFEIKTNMVTRAGSTYAVYKLEGTPHV
tara:strand:+ start:342 stop:605 length:264 start_codon:yes stop_codon:yes gene_type:complete